ncbi:MAG: Nramp family divalent metal transporter [Aureliella sp.]
MAADSQENDNLARSPFRFGPGLLVAAAFIGPGTITVASQAGAAHGGGLMWVVALSVIGAIVLQQLAARLGVLSGSGLSECVRTRLKGSPAFYFAVILIIAAIGIGNAAYQTGNLAGAATGLSILIPITTQSWVVILGGFVIALLWFGNYQWLQRTLVALVCLLSVAFIVTALISTRDWPRLLTETTSLKFPDGGLNLVLGLIGTTIVPYNLFLHSSTAAKTWGGASANGDNIDRSRALKEALWDTRLSIGLGGIVTAAVLITASNTFFVRGEQLEKLPEVATQLEPLFGSLARVAFALGLFAAGLTSSITAPLATAFAVRGLFEGDATESTKLFRWIAIAVVATGIIFAVLAGGAPQETISLAQVANGILLPIIATLVLWAALASNLPNASMSLLQRILASSVVLAVTALSLWRLLSLAIGS